MTRLASTGWTSALLGLAFTGAAFAQTAPADDPTPQHDPNDDTARETTPSATPPAADVDVDVDAPDVTVQQTPDYAPPPVVVEEEEDYGPLSGIGISLAAGGGASGFTNDTMSDTTGVGGDWDVRMTFGTRTLLAFEGSYIGSAQNIDALGLDNDAILVGNGLQGALRINATLDYPIQPFAYGGAAWRHYDLTNADTNLSDVAGADDVLEIPLGIGVGGRWGSFMADARGEYRWSADEDMVPSANNIGESAAMDRWGVKGTVGVEF